MKWYSTDGLLQIPEFLPVEFCQEVVLKVREMLGSRILRDGESTGRGHSHYITLDGFLVRSALAELWGVYAASMITIERIHGDTVKLSPWIQSAVNVKIYPENKGMQGWHYDTNPISALLYLTDGGGPTEFILLDGSVYRVHPEAGKLVVFQGKKLFHHVLPGQGERITVPMNYYTPDDCERDFAIDLMVYGEKARVTHSV